MNWISILKLFGHARFASIRVELQPIDLWVLENQIEARWTVRGIGGLEVMWVMPKKWLGLLEKDYHGQIWMECVSTLHVNDDGKIWKHVLDNRKEDRDREKVAEAKPSMEKIKEKLSKLKGEPNVPAPSL